MSKSIHLKTAGLIVITALIVILGAVTAHRAESGSNDFDTFYEAGRAVLTGEGLYYKGEFYDQGSKTGPFLYPPFAALFFALYAWLPLAPAAFLWCLSLILCFSTCFLWTLTHLNFMLNRMKELWLACGWIDRVIFIVFPAALLLDNLTMAQFNLVVLAFSLAALVLWRFKARFSAGMVLAAAILMKATPALFLFYFIAKRQWRVLIGVFTGLLLGTLILPTLVFGFNQNRIYHRQWLGRTVKPMFTAVKARFQSEQDEAAHPLKKDAALIEHERLTAQLTQKNQALSATMTRLLLKDRNTRAYDGEHPVYAAQKYKKLPVLFGGLPGFSLSLLIRGLQAAILLLLFWVWSRRPLENHALRIPVELALVFLSMTLLSPWARSHQFISWLFPLIIAFCYNPAHLRKQGCTFMLDRPNLSWLTYGVRIAFVLYVLQALPYGKPAGMGTLANLVLWGIFFKTAWLMTHPLSDSQPKSIPVP